MKLSLLLPAFILASPIMASPIPGEGHSVDLASLTKDELIAVFDKIAPLVVTDAVLSRRQTLPKAPHEEEFDCVRHCIIEWCGVCCSSIPPGS
jgi:hypothetical protein